MINGNPHEFLDVLYTGQDIVYIFKGIKYWFQGYTTDSGFHMEIIQHEPSSDSYLWKHDDVSSENCKDAFLNAPIFEGKTFWDAEGDIEWVDG